MKSKHLLLGVFLLLLSLPSYAGTEFQISQVMRYFPADNFVHLKLIDPGINPAGCSDPYYYALDPSHPHYEDYKKVILTAKASGQYIGVYIVDNECLGTRPKIHSLFIQ